MKKIKSYMKTRKYLTEDQLSQSDSIKEKKIESDDQFSVYNLRLARRPVLDTYQ